MRCIFWCSKSKNPTNLNLIRWLWLVCLVSKQTYVILLSIHNTLKEISTQKFKPLLFLMIKDPLSQNLTEGYIPQKGTKVVGFFYFFSAPLIYRKRDTNYHPVSHLIFSSPIQIIVILHILCLYLNTMICRQEQQKYYPLSSGAICSDMLADTIINTGG